LRELADFGCGFLVENQLADGVGEVEEFVNGGAAAVAGSAALHATDTLAETEAVPLGGVEAADVQRFVVVVDGVGAVLADGANEALGEDAVEGGDEVVGFDAHVEEAAEDIDDIVGVDGGEDEMAGEGGVDGDLRGFLVTDFADEDLVGVMAEDGTQAAGEGEAFFLVDGNLGDAANLVLDRVFDGDDLVFVAFDFVEGGVESGGFSGAGGAGDEHHPVGLANVAAEAAEIVFRETDDVESEMTELLAHRLLVEHAEDGVLAMDSGHDGDAEVDEAGLVAYAETAVLRDAALGDVELAHDLDAGEDGVVMLAGDGGHGRLQHAVDAVLDDDGIVVGFDVDVGGAALERGEDGGVDQTNDGADVFFAGQLLNGDVFVLVFIASEHVEGEAFARFVENALRLLGFLEQVGDLREGGDAGEDAVTEEAGDFVEHHEAGGIADSDDQQVLLLLDGHEVVAEHELDRDGAEKIVLDFEVFEVDEFCMVAACQGFGLGPFVRTCGHRKCEYAWIGHSGEPLSPTRLAQGEDGQVERDENEDNDHAHDDEDGRFDEGEGGGERGGDVLFEEFGDGVEHLGESAGLFADGNHLRGEVGKDAGFLKGFGQTLAFAHGGDGRVDGFGDAAGGDGAGCCFERRDERQTAGEQRGEGAREERNLILEPDFAEDGQADAKAIDKVAAALGDGEAIAGRADSQHDKEEPEEVGVQPLAEAEQTEGHGRELGTHLVVEHGKLGNDDGEKEDHEADDEGHEQSRIDEGGGELFAEGERDLLEADVALEDFLEVAGAFAGEQGGGVHDGETGLGFEGSREGFAGLDAIGDVVQLCGELGVFLDFAQHSKRAEDRETGTDEGEELLVEDEEGFELDLAPAEAAKAAPGADREDVVAGMDEAIAQLIGGGRGLHLLLHPPPLIGQLDDELCHASARRTGTAGLSREIFSELRVPAFAC
jgi:hypothetical protein